MRRILILITFCSIIINPAFANLAEEDLEDPIEAVFSMIYTAWNDHDAEKLFKFYHKSFVTGDGITKDDYRELTEALWEAYPNIQLENQKRTIRSQDQYATISGIDFFFGSSKEENSDIGKKGILNAISQGQVFLQKFGNEWKIVSDRIQFELVTVYYGNAKEYLDNHQIYFSSPEQVKSGEQYSGTLYFILPDNIKATASINRETIKKPDNTVPEESFQVVSDHKLERLFAANDTSHNELVSATIILSKGIIEPKLDGVLYISKRVNVSPAVAFSRSKQIVTKPFAKSTTIPKEESDS
jgi:hypothetical protein